MVRAQIARPLFTIRVRHAQCSEFFNDFCSESLRCTGLENSCSDLYLMEEGQNLKGNVLTFICPCIASISLKYNQQDTTFSRSIYFYKFFYMFQAVPPPIIRSVKLYIQRQVLSNQYCCLLLSWMRWNGVPSHPR